MLQRGILGVQEAGKISVLNMSEIGFSSAIIVSMYKPLAKGNKVQVCALLDYYRKASRMIGLLILLFGIAVLPWISQLIIRFILQIIILCIFKNFYDYAVIMFFSTNSNRSNSLINLNRSNR